MRKRVYAHAALFSVNKLVYKRLLFAVILYCLWGGKNPSVVICSSLSALHPLFSNWLRLVVTAAKSPQLVFCCVPWFSVAGPNMQNSLLL